MEAGEQTEVRGEMCDEVHANELENVVASDVLIVLFEAASCEWIWENRRVESQPARSGGTGKTRRHAPETQSTRVFLPLLQTRSGHLPTCMHTRARLRTALRARRALQARTSPDTPEGPVWAPRARKAVPSLAHVCARKSAVVREAR